MSTLLMENAPVMEESQAPRKYRVQLDFETEDMASINQLVQLLRVGTRAELFRSSLRVLRWMAQKKLQGSTVVAITPEGKYVEPEFEFFERLNENLVPPTRRQAAPNAPEDTGNDYASANRKPVHA